MARKTEKITVTHDGLHDCEVMRHPAFGQISVSRVAGHRHLYGSDFAHQHYVTLTIRGSEMHRSLARDWPYAREHLVEVSLSEAQ